MASVQWHHHQVFGAEPSTIQDGVLDPIRRLEAATGRDLPYHLDYCIDRPLGVICITDVMHMCGHLLPAG